MKRLTLITLVLTIITGLWVRPAEAKGEIDCGPVPPTGGYDENYCKGKWEICDGDVQPYYKKLATQSFMDRVDRRALKKYLGGKFDAFVSSCYLPVIDDLKNEKFCTDDAINECTSDNSFTKAVFYMSAHREANEELLVKYGTGLAKNYGPVKKYYWINQPCSLNSIGNVEDYNGEAPPPTSLEDMFTAATAAEEPIKIEDEIRQYVSFADTKNPLNPDFYDSGTDNIWTFSARSTWANEHICMSWVDETLDGELFAQFKVDGSNLRRRLYNDETTNQSGDWEVVRHFWAVDTDSVAGGTPAPWCNLNDKSKCIIHKNINIDTNDLNVEQYAALRDRADGLIKYTKPQDYLTEAKLIWPFEYKIVFSHYVPQFHDDPNNSCEEHVIYPADDTENPLSFLSCKTPENKYYTDLTGYQPKGKFAKRWEEYPLNLLLSHKWNQYDSAPVRGIKKTYYVCVGSSCIIQYYHNKVKRMVKLIPGEYGATVVKVPDTKLDYETISEDAKAGVLYYGLVENGEDDTYSIIQIKPFGHMAGESVSTNCLFNGQQLPDTDTYEKMVVKKDIAFECTTTVKEPYVFADGNALGLELYEYTKACDDKKNGCEETYWESEKYNPTPDKKTFIFSGSIPIDKMAFGKSTDLFVTSIVKLKGKNAGSADASIARVRTTFGIKIMFLEDDHFICKDGSYAETCTCSDGEEWNSNKGICVPDCGSDADWSISFGRGGASNECKCTNDSLQYNSALKKCYNPSICGENKKYNEETDACICEKTVYGADPLTCLCPAGTIQRNDYTTDFKPTCVDANTKSGNIPGGSGTGPVEKAVGGLNDGCAENSDCAEGMACENSACVCDTANGYCYDSDVTFQCLKTDVCNKDEVDNTPAGINSDTLIDQMQLPVTPSGSSNRGGCMSVSGTTLPQEIAGFLPYLLVLLATRLRRRP